MKNLLAQTENRRKLSTAYQNLLFQPDLLSVRMALVTGGSGFGKTKGVADLAANEKIAGIYISCSPNESPKSLLEQICIELDIEPAHRIITMQNLVIDRLKRFEQSLFVDEINALFDLSSRGIPQKALAVLETLRHIHDKAGYPIILVGTDLVRKRLEIHEQLCRRISQRIEFTPMSQKDAQAVVETCCDVSLDEETINDAYLSCQGSIGRFVVLLSEIERYCRIQRLPGMNIDHYRTWTNSKPKGSKGGNRA